MIRFKRKSPSPPHSGTAALLLGAEKESEQDSAAKKGNMPRSKEQVRDSHRMQPTTAKEETVAEPKTGRADAEAKPRLAQDLIKSLMNKESANQKQQPSAFMSQSRAGPTTTSGKKLKLRRSPAGRSPPSRSPGDATKSIGNAATSGKDHRTAPSEALNFTTDMKRLGLMADIQNNIKDHTENKKKLVIKKRHISPPPYLQGVQLQGDPAQ